MAASKDVGVSPFHAAVYYVASNLEEGEVKALKFLCKKYVPKAQLESADALQLFDILENQGIITEQNYDFLLELLTHIQREDLKSKFLEIVKAGGGNSPDQPSLGSWPPQTLESVHQQGPLKSPDMFTPALQGRTSPGQINTMKPPPGFTPTLQCGTSPGQINTMKPPPVFTPTLQCGTSPGQSTAMRRLCSFDGSPVSSSGYDQSVQNKSFARSTSLQSDPPGQSSLRAAHPKVQASSSVGVDKSAGFSHSSFGQPGTPSNFPKGSSVDKMMENLSLQKFGKSIATNKSSGIQDDDDLQTDSPVQRGASSRSVTGQDWGPVTPSGMTHSRSHPREMSVSHQGLGSTTWPVLHQSPGRNQPASDRRPPIQGQGSTSGPLLDLSTDSSNDAERAREARNLRGLSSPQQGQQSAPNPLVDLSRGIDQVQREIRPPAMSPEERVARMNQMFDQRDAREEVRAAEQRQPDLRNYQKELAERPLQNFENHIICAPTGSGKTLTAAYICYEYWEWFRINVRHKHFKALFIVNMRHLTEQQRNAFRWYFPVKQDVQTIGEVSFEEALKLDDAKPAVLMLTAQILVNALKSGKIDIGQLDMLIFDECHHTDLKHPYNEIMKLYLKQKQSIRGPQQVGVSGPRLPFVIGLSASLGVGSEALRHLLTLCGNMDSKGVVRVLRNLDELEHHVNRPEEDKIEIVSTRAANDMQFADLLEALMAQIEDQLPDIDEHPLPSCGCQLYEAEAMRRLTEAQKSGHRTAVIVYMYLYEYNRALMLYDDLRVTDAFNYLERFHSRRRMIGQDMQVLVEEHCQRLFDSNLREMKRLSRDEHEHSNEKLGRVAFLLHGIFSHKPESKGIVLVRMKVATTAVADFIKKSTLLRGLPCRVIPKRFVGQGDIEDECMTEAEQKAALQSFRREDGCNVLVATDIAQEGLDMPACNFVIRYNFVSNEIGTVQSKGRARAEGSQCFLIVESGSLNEKRELDNRHKVRKMMEAMEDLEAMTEDQRLDMIQERQNEILEKIRAAEEEAALQQSMTDLDKITVHCKECSALVCKASELRRKGDAGHVTCISQEFKRWVREVRYSKIQRYRDTETVGLIKCGTFDCGNQLGTMQKFLNLDPPDGYALKAQSFKIHFERGGVKTPKMWKKAGFQILQG